MVTGRKPFQHGNPPKSTPERRGSWGGNFRSILSQKSKTKGSGGLHKVCWSNTKSGVEKNKKKAQGLQCINDLTNNKGGRGRVTICSEKKPKVGAVGVEKDANVSKHRDKTAAKGLNSSRERLRGYGAKKTKLVRVGLTLGGKKGGGRHTRRQNHRTERAA